MESRGGEGRVARAAPSEGQAKDEAQSEIEARSQIQDDGRQEAQPISAKARLTALHSCNRRAQ